MSEGGLRISERLRHEAEEIFKLTDPFCAEHLDAEYADLCRRVVARLARKRPSPLDRGDLRIWAGAVISRSAALTSSSTEPRNRT